MKALPAMRNAPISMVDGASIGQCLDLQFTCLLFKDKTKNKTPSNVDSPVAPWSRLGCKGWGGLDPT